MKYNLTINKVIITEFNESTQEFSGKERVETVAPDFSLVFETEKIGMNDILQVLREIIGVKLELSDLFFCNGSQGSFTIENKELGSDGLEKLSIHEYYFTVTPVVEPLNLEAMFV